MLFAWLKKYLPRSLYGRAALILLVPVVVIQVVVLVAFSQRYFEDITRQLMRGVVADVGLYLTVIEEMPESEIAVAMDMLDQQLGFSSTLGAAHPVETRRDWYDFSARVIRGELEAGLFEIDGVDTETAPSWVVFSTVTERGRLTVKFPRNRASARNPHQLMVWTLFTGIVITLIAAVFLRNQLRPIRRLAQAAAAFGRGETLPYRLAGATEVRSAGAAFLNMRTRIERQIEQRTLMLSGVSHDLRTPLTRLKLGLSMLEAEGADVDEIAAMQADIEEMEGLITAFLDFARADALEDPMPCDLKRLIQAVHEKAVRAGGKVNLLALPEKPCVLAVRQESLTRALDNLVSNGMRYGENVQLSLNLYDRSAVLSVEDDGPGISPTARDEAMQPFVRLDPSRNQDKGSGVGLGLAIALDIARRHGGILRLGKSETLGGLKADLVLPRHWVDAER